MGDDKDWMPDFEKSKFASEEQFLHRHQQRKWMPPEDFEMGRKADTSTFQVFAKVSQAKFYYFKMFTSKCNGNEWDIPWIRSCFDQRPCAALIDVEAPNPHIGVLRAAFPRTYPISIL